MATSRTPKTPGAGATKRPRAAKKAPDPSIQPTLPETDVVEEVEVADLPADAPVPEENDERYATTAKEVDFSDGSSYQQRFAIDVADLDDETRKACETAWSNAILRMRSRSTFFSTLLLFLPTVWTYEVERAATNYKEILLNPKWFISTSTKPPEQAGAAVHEVLHNAMGHNFRCGHREHDLWNVAGDISINGMINAQFDKPSDRAFIRLPSNVVVRRELEHLPVEEIYEILLKERENKGKGPPPPPPPGGNGKPPPGGQKGGPGGGQGKQPGKPGQDPAGGGGQPGQGGNDGGVPADQDNHAHDFDYKPRCIHKPVDPTAKERDKARDMVNRAYQAAKKKGDMPAGMEQLLGREIDKPRINWRQALSKYLVSSLNDFAGPFDRRFLHAGYYFETLEDKNINLYVAIDTSGSMGAKEINLVLNEIAGIVSLYPNLQAKFYWADAAVYGPHPLEDIMAARVQGGGGTDFRPFFQVVEKELADSPTTALALYLTDGYGTFPDWHLDFPVMWAVMPGGLDEDKFPPGHEVVKILASD